MGEGGLAEGGEESAGEKGWEECVPSDDREVIIFRPFFESVGSQMSMLEAEVRVHGWALPSRFEICPSDVVDKQCDVQIVESLRDSCEVDGGTRGICNEGLDSPVLPESLDLLYGRLEFLLVPTMNDDVEALAVELLR